MPVNPIPAGYHSLTPYLIVSNAAKAIEYYKKAFGAEEVMRFEVPGGKIAHAEIKIGDSCLMLADEHPEQGHKSPTAYGGSPMSLMLYVKDVDSVFKQATAAGGKPVRPVENQFYGDRLGALEDPFGHTWTVSTHIEDVSVEEAKKRMAALHK